MSKVHNEIENEIIITTATTARRILSAKHGGDAFALYNFYAYTAVRQKTNNVKATDNFCMKGLEWGKTRFYRAKKVLQDLNVIEQVIRHDEGRIQGNYILVRYLRENYRTPENSRAVLQESGKTETNTNKENINTNKKNINAVEKTSRKKMTTEYLQELADQFPTLDVSYEWEKAQDYIKSSGKRYKDMRAFFRNWLRRTLEGTSARKGGGVYVE